MASASDVASVCSEAPSNASTLFLPGSAEVPEDLQNAAIHGGDGKMCCTCDGKFKKEDSVCVRASSKIQPDGVWRCRGCHALKSRINRIMGKNGQLARDWGEMTESERAAFVKENKNLYGAELELRITESMTITKAKRSFTSFTGTGEFKTEHDIRQDWKDQPDVADNIIKFGRKFFDPVKKIYVYEDVTYSTKQEDSEERKETQRMRLEAGPNALAVEDEEKEEEEKNGEPQPVRKKRKTNNPKKTQDSTGASTKKPEKPEKPAKVSKSDISFAKKYIAQLAPQKVELNGLKEKTSGQEHLYPAHVLTFAQQTLGKIDEWYNLIEPIFKGEKHVEEVQPDKKKFEEDIKHIVGEGSMAIERLRVQVNEVSRWNK
eukprot:s3503_g1.t1